MEKHRYFPTVIYVYGMNAHFIKKGEYDCLSGQWKGVDFVVFVVKEENYSMNMISTYYGIVVHEDQKE